jgi:myo-inositol 2-dehydrogenase/D-chiro-inositol 1-dehydrogenase
VRGLLYHRSAGPLPDRPPADGGDRVQPGAADEAHWSAVEQPPGTFHHVGWWPVRERSGGPVVEQAAHVLDLARLFAGEVAEVFAMGDGQPPEVPGADVDGVTTATLRFRSGALGTLSTTCVLGWKQRAGLEVVADGLWLSVSESGLAIRADGADPVEEVVAADPAAARVAVDRAFVDAVRGIGDDVRVPYAEALRTHRLACALASSAATGRPMRPADGPEAPGPAAEDAPVARGRR